MSLLYDSDLPFSLLQFYATSPYPCSYLPEREARSQVATPAHLITTEVYSALVRAGFRRSGVFAYRPACEQCRACLSVRLPVFRLQPGRSQRRAWRQHAGLVAEEVPLLFDESHFDLYCRYQIARHAGHGMDQDSREQYAQFLLQSHIDTRLIEFREGGTLRMVSLIDVLNDGISSVYTFFDPDVAGASYGTYNILWQATQARTLGLPYLYLGYWIAGSRKMAYKSRFHPLQILRNGIWQEFPDGAPSELDTPD